MTILYKILTEPISGDVRPGIASSTTVIASSCCSAWGRSHSGSISERLEILFSLAVAIVEILIERADSSIVDLEVNRSPSKFAAQRSTFSLGLLPSSRSLTGIFIRNHVTRCNKWPFSRLLSASWSPTNPRTDLGEQIFTGICVYTVSTFSPRPQAEKGTAVSFMSRRKTVIRSVDSRSLLDS